MTDGGKSNATLLFAFVVVSVAVAGYFTGLQAPMKASSAAAPTVANDDETVTLMEPGVVPATHYKDMAGVITPVQQQASLADLKSTIDPQAAIIIDPNETLAALAQREQNRAFNGAPPTIPHPIDQRTDASCAVCHGDGVVTRTLHIPRMSHGFLANCTQCHVENNPKHMASTIFRENEFTGLEAPTGGKRAFAGAPPQIPHSTWMRSDCMSCHGYAGRNGIRTTHPWRSSCQQCHAPSAAMDQTLLAAEPTFLPGPRMKD